MPELSPVRLMPYLAMTELPLPERPWRLWDSGPLFVERMRLAQHAGVIALVMQGSQGELAMAPGDVVGIAKVSAIDWLTEPQIRIELDVMGWGVVFSDAAIAYPSQINVQRREPWPQLPMLNQQNLLVERLADLVRQRPDWCLSATSVEQRLDPAWVCLRWLELLPLSVRIKQRLLQAPSPKLALRYLKKIVRNSDRFASVVR